MGAATRVDGPAFNVSFRSGVSDGQYSDDLSHSVPPPRLSKAHPSLPATPPPPVVLAAPGLVGVVEGYVAPPLITVHALVPASHAFDAVMGHFSQLISVRPWVLW